MHQGAFLVSIPAGIVLVVLARSTLARVSVAIYALTLVLLFGVSAAYHRGRWSPRALRRMRKLDHATIFVLIAGTYTPLSLLSLRGAWRGTILVGVWVGALLGVLLKTLAIDHADVAGGIMYIALGWLAILALPQLAGRLGGARLALLIGGGLAYTAGAAMFATRRPKLKPAVFGFHEMWHSMVIGGSLCHYTLILTLGLSAR